MADDDANPSGLAGHLKDALVGAHAHLADKIDERKKAHVANVLEQFEADLGPLLAPMIEQAIANPETPEEWKPLLREAAAPEHFSGSLLIGVAVGAIIGPVLGSAVEPYVQGIANTAWGVNPSRPIPVDVLVASKLKNVTGPFDPGSEAALSGIKLDRFNQMVEAAGNALGFEQAIELERRGLLVGTTLQQVLEYSNVNPKFYAAALNLITNPVSIAEVLNGRIRTHLNDAQARDLYAQAGGIPGQYQWRLDSTGRPPGPMEVGTLFNRKIIDDTVASAMLAQSDLALQFQSTVKELWKYYPPPRSLVPMLKAGAITDAQFREWMSFYGAPADVVTAFAKEANHAGSSGIKELTQAQVARVYSNRLIDRPTADARITALGYSAQDANLILELADSARTERLLTATINKIGSLYVAHKIDKPSAATSLNAAQVPNAAQVDLFALWDVERSANLHFPTPAAIVGALRRGLIDPKECYQRLTQLGVQVSDLAIVVGDGWPPTAPQDAQAAANAVIHQTSAIPGGASGPGTAAKRLTASQISRAYSAGSITRATAIAQLVALGYTAADAAELLTLVAAPA